MEATCSVCRKFKTDTQQDRQTGLPICKSCKSKESYYDTTKHETCSVCGERKYVATWTNKGEAVCINCNKKDTAKHKACSVCGEIKRVTARTSEGKAVCKSCHEKTKIGVCIECGQTKIIQAFSKCYGCVKKHYRYGRS